VGDQVVVEVEFGEGCCEARQSFDFGDAVLAQAEPRDGCEAREGEGRDRGDAGVYEVDLFGVWGVVV
jgi:hypothetical protein